MTDEDPDRDVPGTRPDQDRQSGTDAGERRRLIELLGMEVETEPVEERLHRRAAVSAALARLAANESGTVRESVDVLVDELRTERTRERPAEGPQTQVLSREVTNNLVRSIGLVITEQPHVVAEIEDGSEYIRSIATDLETDTLRIATEALFASASALQDPDSAVERLGELLTYPDDVVQAWSAGALGQLAEEHPDTVAAVADDLRGLLDHADETVQHNATEAFGSLVSERPDVVAPAAPLLRELLDHTEVAIQHNAAGVLGRLAETHPEVVLPAVDEFKRLCEHDDEAIRKIAATTLANLANG